MTFIVWIAVVKSIDRDIGLSQAEFVRKVQMAGNKLLDGRDPKAISLVEDHTGYPCPRTVELQ